MLRFSTQPNFAENAPKLPLLGTFAALLVNSARKTSADKYQRTLKLSGVSAREALFHFELESQVKTLLCTTKKL
jgi:hypothetical protein